MNLLYPRANQYSPTTMNKIVTRMSGICGKPNVCLTNNPRAPRIVRKNTILATRSDCKNLSTIMIPLNQIHRGTVPLRQNCCWQL